MREFAKVVSVVVIMVSSVAAALVWTNDKPDAVTWTFRIACPVMVIGALAMFLAIHFRKDLVTDYLRKEAGNYFNRGGFCFTMVATEREDYCYMNVLFQNQRDARCIGRIALRPARGFWMDRPEFDTITYRIDCEPAAFGIASVPIPVPFKNQGKPLSFEVGASVEYPNGKGKQVRFFDGVPLRTNTRFNDSLSTTLTVVGAATGTIVLSRPATMKVELPSGVCEVIPADLQPEQETLWKLGDPSLETETAAAI